jgi:hypothetical protein
VLLQLGMLEVWVRGLLASFALAFGPSSGGCLLPTHRGS